jgi:PI31 proteasome regulator N-terminal
MADALPTHARDDTNSDVSSSYEAIALFCHACMTAVGFRLVGFEEGQKIGTPRFNYPSRHRIANVIPSEAECVRLAPRLSPQWNSSFGSHSFVYAHSQSSMQFVIKVDRLGGKAEIRGIGLGDERITRFEITAKDYVSPSALPLRIPMTLDGEEDRSDLPAKLKETFISELRIRGTC